MHIAMVGMCYVDLSNAALLEEGEFFHSEVIKDLEDFKQSYDVILVNRLTNRIRDVCEKVVYTRDLFGLDQVI